MRTLAASVLVLWVAVQASAQQADPKLQPPDYYPLKVGTKWHYSAEVAGQSLKLVNQIVKIEKLDGVELARLETSMDGSVQASEHLRTTAKGIFRYRINGLESTPPFQILRFPVKKGDTWEQEIKVGQEKMKVKNTVSQEEVTVPSGKYKAVVIKVEGDLAGQKFETTYWLAAGVGVVKQTADIAGIKITLELEKFQASK